MIRYKTINKVAVLGCLLLLAGSAYSYVSIAGDIEPNESFAAKTTSKVSGNEEVIRLKQDIDARKDEIESINDNNQLLQKRMENLKSRIQGIKKKLLEDEPLAPEQGKLE